MPKKPLSSLFGPTPDPVAEQNAANWNAPGGGYDQWKQGDAQREKALPVGGMVKQEPINTAVQPMRQPTAVNAPPSMDTMSVPIGGWDSVEGLISPGNIPLYNRKLVPNNENGKGYSTVRSMSFQESKDGPEILVPTVVNGKLLSEDEARKHYTDTGEHMGMFINPDYANAYASKYHNDAAAGHYNSPRGLSLKGVKQ